MLEAIVGGMSTVFTTIWSFFSSAERFLAHPLEMTKRTLAGAYVQGRFAP